MAKKDDAQETLELFKARGGKGSGDSDRDRFDAEGNHTGSFETSRSRTTHRRKVHDEPPAK